MGKTRALLRGKLNIIIHGPQKRKKWVVYKDKKKVDHSAWRGKLLVFSDHFSCTRTIVMKIIFGEINWFSLDTSHVSEGKFKIIQIIKVI